MLSPDLIWVTLAIYQLQAAMVWAGHSLGILVSLRRWRIVSPTPPNLQLAPTGLGRDRELDFVLSSEHT